MLYIGRGPKGKAPQTKPWRAAEGLANIPCYVIILKSKITFQKVKNLASQ